MLNLSIKHINLKIDKVSVYNVVRACTRDPLIHQLHLEIDASYPDFTVCLLGVADGGVGNFRIHLHSEDMNIMTPQ